MEFWTNSFLKTPRRTLLITNKRIKQESEANLRVQQELTRPENNDNSLPLMHGAGDAKCCGFENIGIKSGTLYRAFGVDHSMTDNGVESAPGTCFSDNTRVEMVPG